MKSVAFATVTCLGLLTGSFGEEMSKFAVEAGNDGESRSLRVAATGISRPAKDQDGGRLLTEMDSMDGAGDDGRPAAQSANDVSSDAEIVAKLIDGSRTQPGEFPFYAAVLDEHFGVINSLVCGGTLIAERVVLSAAHCTETGAVDKIKVGAYGAPGLGNQGEPFHVSEVTRKVNHPRYDPNTLEYDVALYLLDRPVTNKHLLDNMMNLDYGNTVEIKDGEQMTTIGLGYLDNNGRLPAYLQRVDLKYVANWRCRLKGWPYLSSDMMCATDPNGEKDGKNQDSCSGDSGGPLLVLRDGEYKQVGIVSYGSNAGCGVPTPGVYSRVSESAQWIKETICESLDPTSSMCPKNNNPQKQCNDLKDCSWISNKWKWVQSGLCLWDDLWQDCDRTCSRC